MEKNYPCSRFMSRSISRPLSAGLKSRACRYASITKGRLTYIVCCSYHAVPHCAAPMRSGTSWCYTLPSSTFMTHSLLASLTSPDYYISFGT
uniref:Uncharacterized protein n=1 Tax=Picea glauca TaxID=3330 RepID=A0A101LY07_PICGL|nr:hypothetical protein ABT39_MTgene5595 [Picea glauca]QHR89596.1 hypothetical protein Q903MT_gene3618 [Picea sitchensis]